MIVYGRGSEYPYTSIPYYIEIYPCFCSSAKVTIELKKKGSHGKLPFGEKGVNHENPTGIVHGKWGDLPL